MIMFIGGFVACLVLVIIAYFIISAGFVECVEDRELALAIYLSKHNVWEITEGFEMVIAEIEHRKKYKPHTIRRI